ncbi:hypothetical protein GCM10010244_21250 [Streptomyces coeruleorubidus]|nr:hypothetical protein GCM10010244_21250 [Streptomyces bellus]
MPCDERQLALPPHQRSADVLAAGSGLPTAGRRCSAASPLYGAQEPRSGLQLAWVPLVHHDANTGASNAAGAVHDDTAQGCIPNFKGSEQPPGD